MGHPDKEGETEARREEEVGRETCSSLGRRSGAGLGEIEVQAIGPPEHQRFGEKEAGRRWEEAYWACYDLGP